MWAGKDRKSRWTRTKSPTVANVCRKRPNMSLDAQIGEVPRRACRDASVRMRGCPSGCRRASSQRRTDCECDEDDAPQGDGRCAEASHVHDDLQRGGTE